MGEQARCGWLAADGLLGQVGWQGAWELRRWKQRMEQVIVFVVVEHVWCCRID
jgi:hypothetical protein